MTSDGGLAPEFVTRLVQNVCALHKEATFLRTAGYFRRSAFLAMTSYEEIMKLGLLAKQDHKAARGHKSKFGSITSILNSAVHDQIETQIKEQLRERNIAEKTISEFISKHAPKLSEALVSKCYSPEKIRQALLYEDIDKQIPAQIFADQEILEKLCEVFIEGMQPHIDRIEDILKKVKF